MWGDDNDNGSVWGRQDADRDVFNNPSTDAWGNPTDRNGWGDVDKDVLGNDWSSGASDVGSASDSGGVVEGLLGFFGGLFG